MAFISVSIGSKGTMSSPRFPLSGKPYIDVIGPKPEAAQ